MLWRSSAPAPQDKGSFKVDYSNLLKLEGNTDFTGYDKLEGEGVVTALLRDGKEVTVLNADQSGTLVLDSTPFYAESGGQAGDTGYLNASDVRLEVSNTTKSSDHHLHHVKVLRGSVKVGDTLSASVDVSVRQRTRLSHSATHLLHAALREVLGDHVQQKGSLVDSQRLRFDFSHPESSDFEAVEDN